MSRQFNGSTQALSVAIDLSSFAQVSISYWLWWDTYTGADKMACEYAAPNFLTEGFVVDMNAGGGVIAAGVGHSGSLFWWDSIVRPTVGAWHHYVFTYNRATPVNTAFVDGLPVTMTTITHNASTYGNFGNSTLNLMSRNHASLWGPGRMAHYALWGGTLLTARQALALSSGASPMRIGPVPTYYWPLFDEVADYGGARKTMTLTATPTVVAHPPVMARPW